MKFNSQKELELSDVNELDFDLAFVGASLDDRGDRVIGALRQAGKTIVEVEFDADKMAFTVAGKCVGFRELKLELDSLLGMSSINKAVLEGTTLGVGELLYLMRWLMRLDNEVTVEILYVEPESYPSLGDVPNNYGRHNFDLSSMSVGYKALPGFTKTVPSSIKAHLIALLGFERVRLGQLLENDEGAFIGQITPVFGVPGFKPQYDKHSAYQNIEVLLAKGEKSEFSSANNPYDTYRKLTFLKQCLPNTVINVAPIGTKPMSIGACIFVLENLEDGVGVMYDHPVKKRGRSVGVSRIHSYEVNL